MSQPSVSGHTRVAAVIGDPVRHSLSPAIHNAGFAALGLDWVYVALPTPAGQAEAALATMRHLDIGGLSVTMPLKAEVAELVDQLSPAAAALGSVNCVVNEGGSLVGHNTDGVGFVDSLVSDVGIDPVGGSFCVLGSGGAARAVIWALADAGAAEVTVVARRPEAAAEAAVLAGDVGRVGTEATIVEADVVINATPVGMIGGPAEGELPCPASAMRPGQIAADLVYRPFMTPWMETAAQLGAKPVGGVGMLLHQAAHAFGLWTGQTPPLEAMRAAVEEHLGPIH